jgi:hypothetical protein
VDSWWDATEPLPVAPSTPSLSATWWRGGSSPAGLWDCGSNLYQTVSCTSMIRITWAVYRYCDHINIIPIVDLLFMRCKDVFVSNVRVDAYVTLFLCSCSDPTSMLGLVRGMYALVGVIEEWVWRCDRNLWAAIVFTFLWLPQYGECFTLCQNIQWKMDGLLERMHSVFNIML